MRPRPVPAGDARDELRTNDVASGERLRHLVRLRHGADSSRTLKNCAMRSFSANPATFFPDGRHGRGDNAVPLGGRRCPWYLPRLIATRPSYWLTRFAILRLLGLVYLVAFLSLARQVLALIGHDGLLP